MYHLDAGQDGSGTGERLEAAHGSDSSFDVPVILLDAIVQVCLVSFESSYGGAIAAVCREVQDDTIL